MSFRRSPIGGEVGFHIDWPDTIIEGDYLRSPTGRTYLAIKCRTQMRGMYIGRQHLRLIVVAPNDVEQGAIVHEFEYGHKESKASE